MDVIPDPQLWAELNFGSAELGDPRRTRRLVASVAKIAAHPEKSFTQVFDWNELRGFYRLCNQSQATLAAVQQPHWEHTRQAMSRAALVLILHDTSELDYSSHPHLVGVGQIGNEHGRGFLQHNSLAIIPQPRQVLGLAYQQLQVRQPAPAGESTYQRKRRARESDLWQQGFRAAGPPPQGCCWVDVCDRGSDDYEAMRAARQVQHAFLLRIAQNRSVFVTPAYDQETGLLDYARALPSVGSDLVEIPGRGGRPARTATVQLAAAPVWVPAPAGTPQRRSQPIIPAWVIRIWEPHPPAGIDDPLEWLLLCSLPSQTLEELRTRRDWYCCRWLVEIYHAIEKSGCSEEERRFETAARMETCLAVLAVVAVRVFQLRCALDHQPDAAAEQVGTTAEIQVVRGFLKHKKQRFTVRDFVRGVAKLGGFLGRTGDGEPGVRVLWRGYQRLQDMLQGFHLYASLNSG
jgi:Transposase DNA-binding/Transposase Tn5 dimerisation domain